MITKIPAEKRHQGNFGWLKTNWLFSFADYHDAENQEFGALRVFNDDTVMPGGGFPNHPHESWEIVTLVLTGELTHKDSMGNEEVIKAGEVQKISTGEGIVHSEFNNGKELVHLYQIWFYPNEKTKADYEQKKISDKQGLTSIDISLHADAKISQLKLKSGKKYEDTIKAKAGQFVYITDGNLLINDIEYTNGDQARITGPEQVHFSAISDISAIIIEVLV